MIPPVAAPYEQERLAIWIELNRISEACSRNSAVLESTREKLETETETDVNRLGSSIRRVASDVLVIKTKAIAYGTTAGFVVTGIIEVIRYLHH